MLAILSPAKTLEYKRPIPPLNPTIARFNKEASELAAAMAKISSKKLAALMHISPSLATLNAERYQKFPYLPQRPAIFAFAGDVYTGFEAHSLSEEAIWFAQDHIRILSGLYGLLRPLDEIRPYRLEMGTKWAPGNKTNLYEYWNIHIAEMLLQDLKESDNQAIINLASKEYWAAVEKHLPAHLHIIEVEFREKGPNGIRFNSFAAKRARGLMARYICEHRLTRPESIQKFDSDGYVFDPENSEKRRWRFYRN